MRGLKYFGPPYSSLPHPLRREPPNAMANMQALCEKYAPSVKAYLLIPLVGSLFADFLNSLVITFFINFI